MSLIEKIAASASALKWIELPRGVPAMMLSLADRGIEDIDARLVLRDLYLENQWSALCVYAHAVAPFERCAELWEALMFGLAMPDAPWARAVAAVLMFVPTEAA